MWAAGLTVGQGLQADARLRFEARDVGDGSIPVLGVRDSRLHLMFPLRPRPGLGILLLSRPIRVEWGFGLAARGGGASLALSPGFAWRHMRKWGWQ